MRFASDSRSPPRQKHIFFGTCSMPRSASVPPPRLKPLDAVPTVEAPVTDSVIAALERAPTAEIIATASELQAAATKSMSNSSSDINAVWNSVETRLHHSLQECCGGAAADAVVKAFEACLQRTRQLEDEAQTVRRWCEHGAERVAKHRRMQSKRLDKGLPAFCLALSAGVDAAIARAAAVAEKTLFEEGRLLTTEEVKKLEDEIKSLEASSCMDQSQGMEQPLASTQEAHQDEQCLGSRNAFASIEILIQGLRTEVSGQMEELTKAMKRAESAEERNAELQRDLQLAETTANDARDKSTRLEAQKSQLETHLESTRRVLDAVNVEASRSLSLLDGVQARTASAPPWQQLCEVVGALPRGGIQHETRTIAVGSEVLTLPFSRNVEPAGEKVCDTFEAWFLSYLQKHHGMEEAFAEAEVRLLRRELGAIMNAYVKFYA